MHFCGTDRAPIGRMRRGSRLKLKVFVAPLAVPLVLDSDVSLLFLEFGSDDQQVPVFSDQLFWNPY